MKKLFLILTLVPTLALSQVSSWRNSTPSRSNTSSPSSSYNNSSRESNISSWRNSSPTPTKPGSNIIYTNPYWGWNDWRWNRWGMWGAPSFGWNSWSPMWYWNDWGYRQPARVYVYENGKTDTIKGKKSIYNFGIQFSSDKQIGGFFAVGRKAYFITEFNTTYERDRSTFFPNGQIQNVDFPLISDLVRLQTFYVGVGKRFKRLGTHIMVGQAGERVRWRGRDDVSEITFPKYQDRFMSVKFGGMYDLKNITLKLDYDPIVKNGTLGIGLNF